MTFQQIINKINTEPRTLFLIDGLGAMLSAFLLGFVLVQLEHIFGIPRSTLYFLAFLPCLFAMYDIYGYQRNTKNLGFFLKGIAFMNLFYCCLSIGLAFYHYQTITYFGWTYIVLEVIIVMVIAILELKTAAKYSL